jgi:hypothetical protein
LWVGLSQISFKKDKLLSNFFINHTEVEITNALTKLKSLSTKLLIFVLLKWTCSETIFDKFQLETPSPPREKCVCVEKYKKKLLMFLFSVEIFWCFHFFEFHLEMHFLIAAAASLMQKRRKKSWNFFSIKMDFGWAIKIFEKKIAVKQLQRFNSMFRQIFEDDFLN